MNDKKSNIVVIGGGTGSFTLLRGLKNYSSQFNISTIFTMADDGGSNKILRDEFGLLPTSGIRQAIVALSSDEGLMRDLFTYRYYQGTGISGMTFGNLFMAALADILGSQRKAIEETCELMDVGGHIYPVSYDEVTLLAEYEDGTEVLGEHLIDSSSEKVGRQRISKFRTIPRCSIDKDAKSSIENADIIVLGPGDLYTNTVANLVVRGVPEAIQKSKGKVVFVSNLMTKKGETYDYAVSDFLVDLGKYMDIDSLDYVIVNSDRSFDKELLSSYKKEDAHPVKDDLEDTYQNAKVVRADVLSHAEIKKQKGDKMRRSIVRHDSDRLAKVFSQIAKGSI